VSQRAEIGENQGALRNNRVRRCSKAHGKHRSIAMRDALRVELEAVLSCDIVGMG